MANIQKPDANPIVAALLTWFVLGLGHLIVNGQQRKWMYSLIVTFIGTCLCILPGIVIGILSVVEAYQTAERLQKGETIEENEYFFPPMFKVVKMIDATATCKAA
jgi:hypothetical protein